MIGGFHENSTDEEVVFVMVKSMGGSGRHIVVVIDITELNVLLPMLLIAATLKLYVEFAVNPI